MGVSGRVSGRTSEDEGEWEVVLHQHLDDVDVAEYARHQERGVAWRRGCEGECEGVGENGVRPSLSASSMSAP